MPDVNGINGVNLPKQSSTSKQNSTEEKNSVNSVFDSNIASSFGGMTEEEVQNFIKEMNKKTKFINELNNYKKEGHSKEEVYDYFINKLKDSKNDPKTLNKLVNDLLGQFQSNYDFDLGHGKVADSNAEILDKILSTQNKKPIKNAICTTIHGFAMEALHEAGIEAALLSSTDYMTKDKKEYGPHAVLLYKVDEHKYVSQNFHYETIEVEADNIKDATKKIMKQAFWLRPKGGYFIIRDEKNSYTEYMLDKETVFANDFEKSKQVKSNSFLKKDVEKPELGLRFDYDSSANISGIEAKEKFVIPKIDSAIDVAVGYKKSGETDLLLKSQSFGILAEMDFQKTVGEAKNHKLGADLGLGYANVIGKSESNDYNVNTLKQTANFAYENEFFNNGNTSISAGVKVGDFLSLGVEKNYVESDFRVSAEAGLSMNNKLGDSGFELHNEISAGVIADKNKKNYTHQEHNLIPGFKANLKTALTVKPSDKLIASIGAEGYYLKNEIFTQYGGAFGANVVGQVANDALLYGSVSLDSDRKKLDIGMFNETIANDLILNSAIGTRIARTVDIGLNYNKDLKKGDYSVGVSVKKTF